MEKVEAQLDAARAEAAAGDAALDQRLQVFEAKHFVIERYIGDGKVPKIFELGFTPKLAIVARSGSHSMIFPDAPEPGDLNTIAVKIIDESLWVSGIYNYADKIYYYIAIG
ncbi:MAG: hypothetical protein K2M15_04530 [Oscillospiraceae bacterium]|nr:hypothetical protein [Oscillospiraceae bacterium]